MAQRRSSTGIWIILSVAVTIAFGIFSFVWSVVESQINDLRNDFVKYQTDARWNFATKDFVIGKLDGIKDEEKTYRKGLERQLNKELK